MERETLATQEIIKIGEELLDEFSLAFEVLSK